jgi:acyl carrier protein
MAVTEDVLERVRQIAADIFQVPTESITSASAANTTTGWDSLGQVNLVVALEEAFGLQFTPEEIEQMISVELIGLVIVDKLGR